MSFDSFQVRTTTPGPRCSASVAVLSNTTFLSDGAVAYTSQPGSLNKVVRQFRMCCAARGRAASLPPAVAQITDLYRGHRSDKVCFGSHIIKGKNISVDVRARVMCWLLCRCDWLTMNAAYRSPRLTLLPNSSWSWRTSGEYATGMLCGWCVAIQRGQGFDGSMLHTACG